MWLLYAVAGIAVLAAMSAGLALGLHLVAPAMTERKRVLLAGGLATMLPMSVAFGGFFSEVELVDSEFVLGLAALIVATIAIFSVVCLPPAWLASTRLSRAKQPAPLIEDSDPELLES